MERVNELRGLEEEELLGGEGEGGCDALSEARGVTRRRKVSDPISVPRSRSQIGERPRRLAPLCR